MPVRAERPIVAGEQHHQVVEVPEAVVDRGGGEQYDLLRRATEQALHRAVPGGVLVAQGVRLVDDDQAVGVLAVAEMTMGPARVGGQLLVGGELLEGDDLGRQLLLVDPVLPALLQLSGGDDQRIGAVLVGALLDEGEADLRLPGADTVGVDDAAVAAGNHPRPLVAVG